MRAWDPAVQQLTQHQQQTRPREKKESPIFSPFSLVVLVVNTSSIARFVFMAFVHVKGPTQFKSLS